MLSATCLLLVSWVVRIGSILGFLYVSLTGVLVLGMQGKLGHAAWRWLFYIEGALTVRLLAGLYTYPITHILAAGRGCPYRYLHSSRLPGNHDMAEPHGASPRSSPDG